MKLILLPGLDGTGELFYPIINNLSDKYDIQVIVYPKNERLSYDALIEWVKNQLPVKEEYVIIAESFSGYIAYQIALEEQDNLKLLIFVATFIENPRPLFSKFLPVIPLKLILSFSLPNFISKGVLLGWKIDEHLNALLHKTINSIDSEILYYRLMQIINLKESVDKVTTKSIYLQASKDYLVPKSAFEKFKNSMWDIKLYTVEGTHLLLQNNPKDCAKIIEENLNKI